MLPTDSATPADDARNPTAGGASLSVMVMVAVVVAPRLPFTGPDSTNVNVSSASSWASLMAESVIGAVAVRVMAGIVKDPARALKSSPAWAVPETVA